MRLYWHPSQVPMNARNCFFPMNCPVLQPKPLPQIIVIPHPCLTNFNFICLVLSLLVVRSHKILKRSVAAFRIPPQYEPTPPLMDLQGLPRKDFCFLWISPPFFLRSATFPCPLPFDFFPSRAGFSPVLAYLDQQTLFWPPLD